MARQVDFTVSLETDGVVRVLQLAGELDIASAPAVRAALPASFSETAVTFDLTDFSFMDSSGTAELPRARNRAINEGWRLSVRRLTSSVAKVPAISGVDTVFTITRQVCQRSRPSRVRARPGRGDGHRRCVESPRKAWAAPCRRHGIRSGGR